MFGFKRRRFQKALKPIAAVNEHELACALLDAFRGYATSQQICFYCDARGGFEMSHHKNCVIGAAADRLFTLATYDVAKRRYLTFGEHAGEVKQLRARIQQFCGHTGREHRKDGWWCPECYATGNIPVAETV